MKSYNHQLYTGISSQRISARYDFMPKIADFGLAKHFPDVSSQALFTKVAGTVGYFSPEYATQGELSDKADVYSYGIVVLEVISGRKCIDFSLPLEKRFLYNWVHLMHKKGLSLDVVEPELRETCVVAEVIRAINVGLLCVQLDSKRRPSMSQVVTILLRNMDMKAFLGKSKKDFFLSRTPQTRYLDSTYSISAPKSISEEESLIPASQSFGEQEGIILGG